MKTTPRAILEMAKDLYYSTPCGKRKRWERASKSQRSMFINLATAAFQHLGKRYDLFNN